MNAKSKRSSHLVTDSPSPVYSPDTHKRLEATYSECFRAHQTAQDAANEALRNVRRAEKRLAAAAQGFIEYTQLRLPLMDPLAQASAPGAARNPPEDPPEATRGAPARPEAPAGETP